MTRAEVVAVTATTAGEAPEYEFVFFHKTYLRVLEPPVGFEVRVELEPEEVLEEDEPVEVRVALDACAAVRMLFVDSRLIVVVRPDSSVDLIVVRVVPDLFTRLSTEVEGVDVRVVAVPEEVRVDEVVEDVRDVDVEAGDAVRVAVELEVRVVAVPDVVRVVVLLVEVVTSGLDAFGSVCSRSWPAF